MSYVVNCEYMAERVDDRVYQKAENVRSAWEPVRDLPESYCGNIYSDMVFNRTSHRFSFSKNPLKDWAKPEEFAHVGEVMPSALWLYRLLCQFPCTVHSEGPDGYKLVWQVALRHKATGEVLVFREWKGSFSLGHSSYSAKDIPAKFKTDMLGLLNFLASKECPHPYDGTVAGSVA